VNKLSAEKVVVPATTLNKLYRELALKPPFLLKLDVQGAEAEALRGASSLLHDTNVVICQSDIDDFTTINEILARQGFMLYDSTKLNFTADGTL
jgi:hypothetical protein